jgi:2-haloacid dehalogenase
MKEIKVFAFDAYGTLFDVYSVTALCEELFPGKGGALARLWRTKQLQYTLLRSLMGRYRDFGRVTEEGLLHAAKSLKLDITPGKLAQLTEAYLRLDIFPEVKPGLIALKKKGVRLAILSNGTPGMLKAAAEHSGIAGFFDRIISAEEAGIYKPSPRVYDLGLAAMKVGSDELGFVSSNSWDINGAASAGLATFWIQRTPGEPPEELGYSADRTVKTIEDVALLA